MDGLWYASISRNLSEGIATFWHLSFTKTVYPEFHEHPPLAFGLQSLFFSVFGDHLLVERVYSVLMIFISAFIMLMTWKKVTKPSVHRFAWIPLFIFFLVPDTWWAASNNLLENTMMVFTSASVLFIIRSLKSYRWINLTVAGVLLYLAFLTKGPVSLFVISLPFWMLIFKPDYSWPRFLADTSVVVLGFIALAGLIAVLNPDSITSLTAYFNKQIIGSFINPSHVKSRFDIVWMFLNSMIIAGIIYGLIRFFTRSIKQKFTFSPWLAIFIGLTFSGVFPVMVTLKQSGFYILPVFPMASLAVGLLLLPRIQILFNQWISKPRFISLFSRISGSLLVVSLILCMVYTQYIGRDRQKIEDVKKMISYLPKSTVIGIEPENAKDWYLHGYFYRYGHISIDFKNLEKYAFVVVRKGYAQPFLTNYEKVDLPLQQFELYQLSD